MSSWGRDDPEEGDEEEEEDELYKSVNDHIVFLIDAREDMFVESPTTREQHFINSLKVALVVMKSKIIASDKDSVGIVFFGAESQQTGSQACEFSNVCNFIPLGPPSAESILAVQELVDDPSSIFGKYLKYANATESGTQDPEYCPLKEALMLCTQTFNTKRANKVHSEDFKRVWLFTNDDSPNSHKPSLQSFIIQVAKDSAETGVEISLWHMNSFSKPESPFDTRKFYQKLLTLDIDENLLESEVDEQLAGRMVGAGFDTFDDMITQARRKEVKKRRLGSVKMHLSTGLGDEDKQISLSIYKTILPATRPSAIWLQASTSLPAKTSTTLLDTSTGQVLDASGFLSSGSGQPQLSTYIDVAGTRVPFTAEDMKLCKTLRYPHSINTEDESSKLKVLFFTQATALGLDLNLDASTFVFPDDTVVKGSVTLFATVVNHMVEKGLIGIATFSRVKNSMPRLVAMLPRVEEDESDEEGKKTQEVCGMDLINIPYANEVRDIEALNLGTTDVSQEEVSAAEAVVKGLQFEDGFSYQTLENPAIQHVYSVLQAIALNQEEPDWKADRDDKLQPDKEGIEANKELFDALQTATGAVHSEVAVTSSASRGKKRTADGSSSATTKKAKAASAVSFISSDGSANMAALKADNAEDLLIKETAASLKSICKALKLPVTGNKATLVERIIGGLED